tara:strand:- start:2116 stop:4953 length:2838 start_codon:yes stop_codon:yes gene_type:complete
VGLVYNTAKNAFDVTYEPTDAKNTWNVNRPTKRKIEYSDYYSIKTTRMGRGGYKTTAKRDVIVYNLNPDGTQDEDKRITVEGNYVAPYSGNIKSGTSDWPGGFVWDTSGQNRGPGPKNPWDKAVRRAETEVKSFNNEDRGEGKANAEKNERNAKWNAEANALNAKNAQINAAYDAVKNIALATEPGEYVTRRNVLRNALENAPEGLNTEDLENEFKEFYRDQKLKNWTGKGAKPPYGKFDADYYGKTYKNVADAWDNAVRDDNIDITEGYGNANSYYLWHYTTRGKADGNRGNPAEVTAQANAYVEQKPTDQEIQQLRDRQLGVDLDTSSERLLEVPYIAAEWEKAKNGDTYWKQLAKDNYLDIEEPDEFAALFRLSNRDEDKEVVFANNLNSDLDYGISELEDAINQAAGEKAIVDVKKFGSLAQDTLKLAIDEVKKAKQKEQMLDLYSGFGGFNEIINVNDTLKDSLLGDLSMGGMLPLGDKFEESLEKGIEKVTGINNNVAYNWQEWFDETLSKRYQENLELGLTPEEADQKIQIEADFAKSYINDYLIPRFDESRSMDEFVEYIDVRQEEQNPFQTQDLLNALSMTANERAKAYINTIQGATDRFFDTEFYFNPTGSKGREEEYAAQSERVNSDWARAQKNLNSLVDPNDKDSTTWAQEVYRFGLNPKAETFKDDFAKMHFQIIGQGKGYDAAKDILTSANVTDYIYNEILPELEDEALETGTVFGQFIKPREFADEILEGLDPNVPEDWEKVLEDLGMEDFEGSLDELKEYIAETLQTGSATDIRRSIKYLNEKREKPTQKNLGITYIEREEDEAPEKVKAETQLYDTFVNAGYTGTEDEFYERFMPDVNREDMALLTSAAKGKGFSLDFGDYSDPFSSFASIQSFFPDEDGDQQEDDEEEKSDSDSGLFDLSLDLDSPSTKSKSAQSLLGEFTAGFKFN